jgi:hypothetical protein
MKKYVASILCLVFASGANAGAELPEGWSITTKDQYEKELITWLGGSIPNKVEGDFNGDGVKDNAWILVNEGKDKVGMFVSISMDMQRSEIIQLYEGSFKGRVGYGISLVPPGKHVTACGKGYWKCREGQKPAVELDNPGIEFFKFESASSVFFWNGSEFERVPLTD